MILDWVAVLENRLATTRARLKWARWRRLGMRIGKDVVLPLSTAVDSSFCYLITIGDRCHFERGRLHGSDDGDPGARNPGHLANVLAGGGLNLLPSCRRLETAKLCDVSAHLTSVDPGSLGSPARPAACEAARRPYGTLRRWNFRPAH